ncbi:MAG: pantoate--beta-alanine ligase [Candidatus Azotimanducaceae bacterium]|jgi:pantoate--beta-alanine ligase
MHIAHSSVKLCQQLDTLRFRGGTRRCISLVATRGDLHEGHGAVINAAKTVSDVVVVAILPTGCNPTENLVTNNEFKDIGFIERHQADILFAPPEEPLTGNQPLLVNFNDIDEQFRLPPATLTSHLKVLNAVQPDIMVWGERNFIELSQVRRLISELGIRTQVQCIPTVRHANGVAVSTNDHLFSEEDNAMLPTIFATLRNAAHAIRAGATRLRKVENTAKLAIKGAGFDLEYFHILDEEHLTPATDATTTYRIVTSARINDIPVADSLGLTL